MAVERFSKVVNFLGLGLFPLGGLISFHGLSLASLNKQPHLAEHILIIIGLIRIDLNNHNILIDGAVIDLLEWNLKEVLVGPSLIDLELEVLLFELDVAPVQPPHTRHFVFNQLSANQSINI